MIHDASARLVHRGCTHSKAQLHQQARLHYGKFQLCSELKAHVATWGSCQSLSGTLALLLPLPPPPLLSPPPPPLSLLHFTAPSHIALLPHVSKPKVITHYMPRNGFRLAPTLLLLLHRKAPPNCNAAPPLLVLRFLARDMARGCCGLFSIPLLLLPPPLRPLLVLLPLLLLLPLLHEMITATTCLQTQCNKPLMWREAVPGLLHCCCCCYTSRLLRTPKQHHQRRMRTKAAAAAAVAAAVACLAK